MITPPSLASVLRPLGAPLFAPLFAPLLALLLLWPTAAWAETAPGGGPQGDRLFLEHCSGCHVNGGNIIRRGRTLRLDALERNGVADPAAIARIAAAGIGQMGGYAEQLGEGGAEAVAAWVWQQAQAGWPRP